MTNSEVSSAAMLDSPAELPEAWDLSDLYAGPEDPAIAADLAWSRNEAERFRSELSQRLAGLSSEELASAIGWYETILERLNRVISFAQLYFAGNMEDPEHGRFLQGIQEQYNAVSTATLFFTLELNRLEDDVIERQLAEPAAARWSPWLRDIRLFRPHQLSDELEQMLHEKWVAGPAAWVRLFDQLLARMRFSVGDQALPLSETLNRLDSSDPSVRQEAGQALGRGLATEIETFALITNTLAKDKEIDDRWRHYPRPVSWRNLSNRVEDSVVDALATAVRENHPRLSHRYYAMKARWFGQKQLNFWDRNAPLPGDDDRRYQWHEAREIVLKAFGRFDGRMRELAGKFFNQPWIDGAPRPGKDAGAFCHPVVPSVHPYVLLNFYGRSRDVTTLAHELGHGVHQLLAAEQGLLLSDTPLTLAECASVFGEMLVFRALVDQEPDPARRRRMLAGKVENMLNTAVRQIAFYEFERRVHDERRAGELSSGRLGEIWLDVQRESLGPAMNLDDPEYKHFWAYIPHFIHSPFYVYAYAFGDCLVNSLYQVFSEGHPGFQDRYLKMLSAGGTLHHRELLRPFGLDAGDPDFWTRGLNVISGLIDEVEALS